MAHKIRITVRRIVRSGVVIFALIVLACFYLWNKSITSRDVAPSVTISGRAALMRVVLLDPTAFVGTWSWISEDKSSGFGLTLRMGSSSTQFVGSYCGSTRYGAIADCDSENNSIVAAPLANDSLAVTIHDAYGGGTGHATIKRNNDGSLTWTLTVPPSGFYYLPRQAELLPGVADH
jgi:hypothetical protein